MIEITNLHNKLNTSDNVHYCAILCREIQNSTQGAQIPMKPSYPQMTRAESSKNGKVYILRRWLFLVVASLKAHENRGVP